MPELQPSPYRVPVLLAVVVAFAPHALHLPLWISGFCLLCWGYLLAALSRGWKLPGKRLRNTIAVLATILLLLSYGGRPSLEAGVSVLCVLLALKPMELASRRDAMATLLLASFLIVFNLFFAQNILAASWAIAGVLALAGGLVRTTHTGETAKRAVTVGGKLLLQGAPLALALFFVFPRLPGGLLGYQAPVTLSGFSDSLAPGDVSSMVLSRDVAFRATFQGAIPAPQDRYWRGVVLWDFNGQRWLARTDIPRLHHGLVGKDPMAYSISIEPHGQRWLFALDMPMAATAWATLRQDYSLRSRIDVTRKRTYSLRSFLRYDTGPLQDWERYLGLRLPDWGNPQARELAATWQQTSDSPEQIVQRCLDYFKSKGFTYTLAPEEPGADWIDGFLFTSREGFCAHYAGAMAFLMRAAGVPARVVAGYLGGEENPLGDYLILRQADAHAWVEVWLDNRGWVRVDPTAVVAPARLRDGLMAALAATAQGGGLGAGKLPQWLRTVQMGWDAVNYYWGRAVLDYSWRSQRSILRRLGLSLETWGRRLAAGLLALGIVSVAVLALVLLRRLQLRPAPARSRAERVWRRLCRRLGKAGMPRPSWQGPLDYADNVSRQRPDLAEAMQAAAQYYAWQRYAPSAVQGDPEELKRQARRVLRGLSGRRGWQTR